MRIEIRIERGVWPDQDRIWIVGLEHEVGIAARQPGGTFVAQFYHLDPDELAAIRIALDKRDVHDYPHLGRSCWPERRLVNLPPPEKYAHARQAQYDRENPHLAAEPNPDNTGLILPPDYGDQRPWNSN